MATPTSDAVTKAPEPLGVIQRLIAAAPPLTPAQRVRIGAVLAGGR